MDFLLGLNLSEQMETQNVTYKKCNIYAMKNSSVQLYKGYAGVPENLFINLGGWVICIAVFCILRKIATTSQTDLTPRENTDSSWTNLFYGETPSKHNLGETDHTGDADVEVVTTRPNEESIFSCVKMIFVLKDQDILKKCGIDAVQYLSFQRHCILYTTIIFLATLIIIIPVNVSGDLETTGNHFGVTTISNLDPESPLLWVHILFSFLSLPLCLVIMRHFARTLPVEESDSTVRRTLMITGIDAKHCEKDILIQHFSEAYDGLLIKQIHFAYDIRLVDEMEMKRENAKSARQTCEKGLELTGDSLVMRPYTCGIYCHCPCFREVDALVFYREEEIELEAEVARQKAIALNTPLGIAFITFESPAMANAVRRNYRRYFRFMDKPVSSSVSEILNTIEWEVIPAPSPTDILWANLSVSRASYWGRASIINVILFIVLFFLTTPAIVFDNLYLITVVEQLEKITPNMSTFLPTFFLWAASIIMPFIVTYSNEFMNHWTRSEYNFGVMRKTFTFLLFMIVILPSLGLTSMKALVEWLMQQKDEKEKFRWECMFLPDSGAFFVKYVTTTAFIGTAMELIRVAEIVKYSVRLCFAKSIAEKENVRKSVTWEFAFGQQYSWFLLIFSMVTIYSIACPVIVPFGVVCLIMKHLVDRHNIYYVYNPSKISLDIHETAINIVTIALIVQQLCFYFFSLLRSGFSGLTIVSLCLFLITLILFLLQMFWKIYKKLKEDAAKEDRRGVDARAVDSPEPKETSNFAPNVLQTEDNISIDNVFPHQQIRTYGTNEDSVRNTPVKTHGETSETARLVDDSYQRY